jgi:hypothetical protein
MERKPPARLPAPCADPRLVVGSSYRGAPYLGNVITAAWKGRAYEEDPYRTDGDEVTVEAATSEHNAHMDWIQSEPSGPLAVRRRRIVDGLRAKIDKLEERIAT